MLELMAPVDGVFDDGVQTEHNPGSGFEADAAIAPLVCRVPDDTSFAALVRRLRTRPSKVRFPRSTITIYDSRHSTRSESSPDSTHLGW